MLRFCKYLFWILFLLALVGAGAVGGGLYYLVVVKPGPEISESHIEAILGRESPVFYRNGSEKMGVLFEDIHRQYVTYENIPKSFVNAIVAAEDDQFFSHHGIDFLGIARAMVANFKAGRIVQGGSTITQQTAKNLFKREGRSYQEKLKELLWALRLEYHYPKEKILEFYSNQFFVSGNGHGLGVAARYYFDKSPQELTLVESAFIAGSVKRPNYYNPFTKKNREQPEEAQRRIDGRVTYVLNRMREAGSIDVSDYNRAKVAELQFKKGKMTFALNTMMDMVREGLETPVIVEALEEQGISNVSTSGVRIITTVDRSIQDRALFALRRHCSLLDTQLRGYDRAEVQTAYGELEYRGDLELSTGAFLFGEVLAKEAGAKHGPRVTVAFGPGKPTGTIDQEGFERLSGALARFRKNRWAETDNKDRAALVAALEPGDTVYVSIREIREEGGITLDLEKFGEMEGGALVLKEGAIIAMAGGMENRFYNRAVDAKRLMGSTFKPFIFSAAMQLGWNAVDLLDNRRDVYVFMDRPYFPRPDHKSPHEQVSLSWAGVTSENVAAVWLLYHLTDRLTLPRLRELADTLDMAPRRGDDGKEEGYRQFRQRIRDRFGIVVNQSVLAQAAYDSAVRKLETDFLFEGREEEYARLQRLHYGERFDRYARNIISEMAREGLRSSERSELYLRRSLLASSYLQLAGAAQDIEVYRRSIEGRLAGDQYGIGSFGGRATGIAASGTLARNGQGRMVYTLRRELPDQWMYVPQEQVFTQISAMDGGQRTAFWNEVLLEGVLTLDSYRRVGVQQERELARLKALDGYDFEVLAEIRDFRVMLGLQYLLRLGPACGLNGSLEPVLSFPLGSNVISLLELVRMYETMINGSRLQTAMPSAAVEQPVASGDLNGLAIIERIETPDGRPVYTRKVSRRPVFDKRIAAAITNILQNTIRFGTGRSAAESVRLQAEDQLRSEELAGLDLPVPLGGKTGTANEFRNAAFIGYVPVLSPGDLASLTTEGGYTVGVYTGFDDNQPMVKGTNRISGSSGALPIWSDIASALLREEKLGDQIDMIDLTFNGLSLRYPELDQLFLPVNPDGGGAVSTGATGSRQAISPSFPASLTYGRQSSNGFFEPERFYLPLLEKP